MERRKKGEITSTTVITVVLLLIGFAIIAFVYSQLAWTGTVDREACHTSVIIKATLPDDYIKAKELTPLTCKTRKVCVSDNLLGKGDCSEELGTSYDTVRISGNEEEKREKINLFIAREMADCWAMMGEGKVQIFSNERLQLSNKRECVVCTRIAFEKDVKEEVESIKGLGTYLVSYKVPGKEVSYWDFLAGVGSNEEKKWVWVQNQQFSLDQKAIVFVELDKSAFMSFFTGGAGALVGGKMGASIGSFVGPFGTIGGFIVGAGAGALLGAEAGDEIQDATSNIGDEDAISGSFFFDYEAGALNALECDNFENIA